MSSAPVPAADLGAAPVLAPAVAALLDGGQLRTVLQPLVDLSTRRVVAFEALCRGPHGHPLERPDLLFAAAAREGVTAAVDWAARLQAMRDVLAADAAAPMTLFLNAEPEGLGAAPPAGFDELRQAMADRGVAVVLEITERALTTRPADLLAAVGQARTWGWHVAVDDVGAERASLALMPFLAPDVIKLDLRLVQQRTTVQVAEIVNAVRAQAERTGALLLAEGIETEEHATLATAMGAQFGQGWLFGRPAPAADRSRDVHQLALPGCQPPPALRTLWAGTQPNLPIHQATKPLLVAMSKTIERQALVSGDAAVVIGTFQQARFFTPLSAARYATLASTAAFVAALATGLPDEPAAGVRGTHLPVDDPLTAEWDLAVVGPHFAAALVAHDLGDTGPDAERRFDYALTYDRDVALSVAASLLGRVAEEPSPSPRLPVQRRAATADRHLVAALADADLNRLLRRAVCATGAGVTIADAQEPDQPLVFVNPAFERLSGYSAEQVLGRNCRFLQGEHTDPDAVRVLGEQLRAGRAVTTTLLNRRLDGTSWWNQLSISPVHAPDGRLTHFIGIQNDVTTRVAAERQLTHLATHDALTGALNRAGFYQGLEQLLVRGTRHGMATGLVFLDLDGFKEVNDAAGHAAGDALLADVAERLRGVARPGDLVARLGGDEFAVVLAEVRVVGEAAQSALDRAAARIEQAVRTAGTARLPVRASIGTALHPRDATDLEGLLSHADRAMYAAKATGRRS